MSPWNYYIKRPNRCYIITADVAIVSQLSFSLELSPLGYWNTASTFTSVSETCYSTQGVPDDTNHNFSSDRKSTHLVSRQAFIFQRLNISSVELRALVWSSGLWNGPDKIITVLYIYIKKNNRITPNPRVSIVYILFYTRNVWDSRTIVYRRVKCYVMGELLYGCIICIFRTKRFFSYR